MSSRGRGWFCLFSVRDWSPCQRHHVGMWKGVEVCHFLVSSFAAALALRFASPHCFTVCSFPRGRLRRPLALPAAHGLCLQRSGCCPWRCCSPAPNGAHHLYSELSGGDRHWSPELFSLVHPMARGCDSACRKRRQLLFSGEVFPFGMG